MHRLRAARLAMVCALTAGCDETAGTDTPLYESDDAGRMDARAQSSIDARASLDVEEPQRDAARIDGALVPDASQPQPRLSFRVLTYNVAGLPEGISQSMPSRNSSLISPLLNGYQLALLQEDFAFHPQIVSAAQHPHRSPLDTRGNSLGDGLSFLSDYAFSDFVRVRWTDCFGIFDSGSDCLTPKGYTFARFTLERGLSVDVYNVHADAGSAAGDLTARAKNLRQLAAAIEVRSSGRAVIVAGDLNSRYTRSGDVVPELVERGALTDTWVELARGGQQPEAGDASDCPAAEPDTSSCERIDKVLYRSGGGVTLRARDYRVEGAKFSDMAGLQLSDHRPVSVVFDLE